MTPLVEQILQQIDLLSPTERLQIIDRLLQTQTVPQSMTMAELEWQQALAEINNSDSARIDRKKANIARLINRLNEDNDIEEQQQTLSIIESIEPISI